MRMHYGPWQSCWISNRHQQHKSGRGLSYEHFWQAWFNSVQWFQRRRFKCEKLTDGQRTLSQWQKLTLPMARWANKQKWKCYLMKKEPPPIQCQNNPHFLAVWTKFGTFYFQKSLLKGNPLMRGTFSSLK